MPLDPLFPATSAGRLRVRLVNAFERPYDNAVATARTCYSSRVVYAEDVARQPELRDRIARSTFTAGHHTTLQHAAFQFVIEGVSRQAVWSFLHAHPYYNSEQVSQRYVPVRPEAFYLPPLEPPLRAIFEGAVREAMAGYRELIELLLPAAERRYFDLFPARRRNADRWRRTIRKRAMEVARYLLPVATTTHLYHTVSGLTLHRYRRLCRIADVPREQEALVRAMVAEVERIDPDFFRWAEDPLPLEDTPEAALLAALGKRIEPDPEQARRFREEFDARLGGMISRLTDHSPGGEAAVARGVRQVLGLTASELDDREAVAGVMDPARNRLLGDSLNLTFMAKVTRALHHAHFTFAKRLSHTADSQDQRHRTVPASRPVLVRHYVGGEPDLVIPSLVRQTPEALDRFVHHARRIWRSIDSLLDAGAPAEDALYLLPNAFPIRFEESGDLSSLRHKWVTRLCYNAQEEIWRASVEEVTQVARVHPAIGAHLRAPCTLRHRAGRRPTCPEGPRYCGVPVWKLDLAAYERIL